MPKTSSAWRVHKFGGAALARGGDVDRVCGLVAGLVDERPVLVVSAHQGVTRLLREVAHEAALGRPAIERVRVRHRGLLRELGLDPERVDRLIRELGAVLDAIARRGELGRRELDHVLSFGERLSARIVAAALRARGIDATPVDAFDLGFTSDNAFGRARPLPGAGARIARSLAEVPGVPVVTGFLAQDPAGRLTTLGRNGSDLSAAILAEALGARELVLWKGVPGVLTADPKLVSEARTLERLAFDDALALARAGADVLHPDALAPVRRAGIGVLVLDVHAPERGGTRLVEAPGADEPLAIAGRTGLVRLASAGDDRGLAALLGALAARDIEARHLEARAGVWELWLDEEEIGALGEEALREGVRLERDRALVQLVGGAGPRATARVLERLAAADIAPLRIWAGTDECGPLLGLRGVEYVTAIRCLHAALLDRALGAA